MRYFQRFQRMFPHTREFFQTVKTACVTPIFKNGDKSLLTNNMGLFQCYHTFQNH